MLATEAMERGSFWALLGPMNVLIPSLSAHTIVVAYTPEGRGE